MRLMIILTAMSLLLFNFSEVEGKRETACTFCKFLNDLKVLNDIVFSCFSF